MCFGTQLTQLLHDDSCGEQSNSQIQWEDVIHQ